MMIDSIYLFPRKINTDYFDTYSPLYYKIIGIQIIQSSTLATDPRLEYTYNELEDGKFKKKKIPFIPRTSRIAEDLGLVRYLFTDKTGRLSIST